MLNENFVAVLSTIMDLQEQLLAEPLLWQIWLKLLQAPVLQLHQVHFVSLMSALAFMAEITAGEALNQDGRAKPPRQDPGQGRSKGSLE